MAVPATTAGRKWLAPRTDPQAGTAYFQTRLGGYRNRAGFASLYAAARSAGMASTQCLVGDGQQLGEVERFWDEPNGGDAPGTATALERESPARAGARRALTEATTRTRCAIATTQGSRS